MIRDTLHVVDEKLEFKDMLDSYTVKIGQYSNYYGVFFIIAMATRHYLVVEHIIPSY